MAGLMFIKTLTTLLIFCLAPLAWAANFDYRVEINGLGDQGEKWLPTLDIEAWHDSEDEFRPAGALAPASTGAIAEPIGNRRIF